MFRRRPPTATATARAAAWADRPGGSLDSMRRDAGWQMVTRGTSRSSSLHLAGLECARSCRPHPVSFGEGRFPKAAEDGTADACFRGRMAAKLIRLASPDALRLTISWAAGLALLVAMTIALLVWGWVRGSD